MFENCGVGYSAPAIVKNRLYTLGARDGEEQLLALDATTGEELWHAPIGEILVNDWGDGPRGTPTVDGEFIYALGEQGNLVCVQADDGKVVWTRAMQDFGGKTPTWGYSESPLVVEEKLLCTPGGEDGAIVALDKKTGDELWQMKDVTSPAHYSSIVRADYAAGPECVQLLVDQVIGFDPTDGKVRWSHPWPGEVAVVPTPIVDDEYVYVTTGYGVGCLLLKRGEGAPEEVYANKVMKNKHGGVILLDGHVFGHAEGVAWVCQEFATGEPKWREREALEMGAIGYADGRFYCVGENTGDVVLVEPSTEQWKEHGRFTLEPQSKLRKPKGKIWTHPVLCDGRLYLRDQELLYCYDVSEDGTESK